MNLGDIERLLIQAHLAISHRDFVIVGSLTVLGAVSRPPAEMVSSIDVDLYPKDDPGRAGEVASVLGLGSDFEQTWGYYADAVSPDLPALPRGWQQRLVRVGFGSGVSAWFLDAHDAAVSKYVRSEDRDLRWIRAGLQAGILRFSRLEYLAREVILEPEERERVTVAINQDRLTYGDLEL
jgi:hypothetical protein